MKAFYTLNSNHVVVEGSETWKKYESAICFHDFSDLVHPTKQDTVNFGARDRKFLHKESYHLCLQSKLVNHLFGHCDVLLIFPGDEDLFRIARSCSGGKVLVVRSKGRWKVYGCAGRRFDYLDVLPRATTYDRVYRKFELEPIDVTAHLSKSVLDHRIDKKRIFTSLSM